jgi:hypothetical protein
LSAGVARTAVMAATRIAEVASEVERWGGDEQPPQRGRGRWRRCDLRSRDLRALVYFWQQADTVWEYLLAVFQGLFWPAFTVYEVFTALRRSG